MKSVFTSVVLLLFLTFTAYTQETNKHIYNPEANAKLDIANAVAKADSTGKNVLLQIGGNWCPWCVKFNKFCTTDKVIDTLMKNNYVILHVNYSPENRNLDILKTLDYPQRFGFPVLVILDNKGKRLNTQDTGFLESGDGYDRNKVIEFLQDWTLCS